jgi:mono/diheme cytochrome c family protein
MNKPSRYCLALGICANFLYSPSSFGAGNIQNGKALAEERCVNCHIVGRNAPNAIESQPIGPDFTTIKNIDAAKLKNRLKNSHPVMSKFPNLNDQQLSDLAAYITSVAR